MEVAVAAGIETGRSLVTTMLLRQLKKEAVEAVVDDDPLVAMETELRLDEKRLRWI